MVTPRALSISHGSKSPFREESSPAPTAPLTLGFLQGPPGPQGRLGQPGQQVCEAEAASPSPRSLFCDTCF